MKRKVKISIIVVLSTCILLSLCINKNYATNETNKGNAVNQTSQNSENTTTKSNKTKTTTKSNNANLSNLGITPNDFSGFKPETTSYEVTVPENIQTVEVYAKTQDAKAKVTGTGKKSLQTGENKQEVIVTAENGTQKTYTINIIREIKQEAESVKTENNQESQGLAELKISQVSLEPEFKTDVYEYSAKYIGESTKLEIEAKPTEEGDTIEIVGNDNLVEGENVITLLVSDKKGDNVATYQITINKSLADAEAIATQEAAPKEQQTKMIMGGVATVIVLVIMIFIFIRLKKNRDLDIDDEEEEIPKGLREENEGLKQELDEELEGEEYSSKEKIKEEFLNQYHSNKEEDFGEEYKETKKRGKYKAKRFK